jgi:hypothetical protein
MGGLVPRPAFVIVLVEGKRDERFVLSYLRKLGLTERDWNVKKTASGAGEQWVREQFPSEVKAFRNRQAKAKTKLLVMIDADTRTVQQRLGSLDQALRQAKVDPVDDPREAIARLIPKRNIETWILCENGVTVEEVTDYKYDRQDWDQLIRVGADVLYDWTRPNATLPASCVNSLRDAIPQLRKL